LTINRFPIAGTWHWPNAFGCDDANLWNVLGNALNDRRLGGHDTGGNREGS